MSQRLFPPVSVIARELGGIVEARRSLVFNQTTWLLTERGESHLLEQLLNLETEMPVDRRACDGSLHDLRLAQATRQAAREYALHSGENTGDTEDYLARKRQIAAAITRRFSPGRME